MGADGNVARRSYDNLVAAPNLLPFSERELSLALLRGEAEWVLFQKRDGSGSTKTSGLSSLAPVGAAAATPLDGAVSDAPAAPLPRAAPEHDDDEGDGGEEEEEEDDGEEERDE